MPEIAVSSLTPDELSALEAQGVDLSKGSVPVPKAAAPKAVIGDTQLPTQKPVAAPPPPIDVVNRARERMKNADNLAGPSTYVEKTKDGKVVEQSKEDITNLPPPAPKEDPVEELDKASFLVAMMGGGSFQKTYRLFGNRIEVTFRTRTAQEDAMCAAQAYKDDEFERVPNMEPALRQQLRMNRYLDYQFVRSLMSIGTAGSPPRAFDVDAAVVVDTKHGIGASKLRATRLDLESELAQPMRVALRSIHVKFENLVGRLASEVDNPDFWQAGSAT